MSSQSTTPGNSSGASTGSGSGPPVDFTTLVLSLHESALIYLGVKEQGSRDIDAARYQIELIAMLESKTSGNLTDDEDRLIRTVLYELRTAFLDAKIG
jgi:hypothetical protein